MLTELQSGGWVCVNFLLTEQVFFQHQHVEHAPCQALGVRELADGLEKQRTHRQRTTGGAL